MSISRPVDTSTRHPNPARFSRLVARLETQADIAAKRAQLAQDCLTWIDPTPKSDACYCEAPNFEVTPGGLSYQDAALRCLLGGCVETLESISLRAAKQALREQHNGAERARELRILSRIDRMMKDESAVAIRHVRA